MKLLSYILLGGALLGVAAVLYTATAALLATPYILDSDEYLHATPALAIAVAVAQGDLSELLRVLKGEGFYPPLPPLLYSLSYLVAGPTVATSRIPSLILFALAQLLVLYTVPKLLVGRPRFEVRVAQGFVLFAACTNPVAVYTSTLCMVEPFGLAVVALMLFLLVQIPAPFSVLPGTVALYCTTAALLFSKYTFPALVLPGLGLALLFQADSWKELWQRLWRYGVLVGALGLTFWGWTEVTAWEQVRGYLFDYPARGSALGLVYQLYYPYLFLADFTWSPSLGALLAILAIFGAVRGWRVPAVRFAALALLFSILGMGFVAERSPRHILILFPLFWALVGLGAAQLLSVVPNERAKIGALFAMLMLFIATAVSVSENTIWLGKQLRRTMEHRPETFKLHQAVRLAMPPSESTILFGRGSIPLSYSLVWQLAADRFQTVDQSRATGIFATPQETKAIRNVTTQAEFARLLKSAEQRRSARASVFYLGKSFAESAPGLRIRTELCRERLCTMKRTKLGYVIRSQPRGTP